VKRRRQCRRAAPRLVLVLSPPIKARSFVLSLFPHECVASVPLRCKFCFPCTGISAPGNSPNAASCIAFRIAHWAAQIIGLRRAVCLHAQFRGAQTRRDVTFPSLACSSPASLWNSSVLTVFAAVSSTIILFPSWL
jgi:hypothetical protein